MPTQDHVQCYDAYTSLENVRRCIHEGHHVMILMRGVPGSGKSHLAKSLTSNSGGIVCSTDDFFLQDGLYQFQPEKLGEYHRSNILRVREAMKDGIKPIIVDNTNIFVNHMEPYIVHATTYCYEIFVVEPETPWKYSVEECFRRNTHGIEIGKISSMLQSLKEQGRPPLSSLVGRGREIRLEPPCQFLEHKLATCLSLSTTPELTSSELESLVLSPSTSGDEVSAFKNAGDSLPEVPIGDRPPGLPVSNATIDHSTIASHRIVPAPVAISLAVDPRSHIKVLHMREVATQTNEVVVTLACAGIECPVDDVSEGISLFAERIKNLKPQMKDRAVRMENIPQFSELDVLVAIFPYEEIRNLSHYYQMLGLEECIRLFTELGAYVDWTATVIEGAFVEEFAASEESGTRPHAPAPRSDWQRVAEQENLKECVRCDPTSETDSSQAVASLVSEVTVTLGVDLLQKMSILFGEGVTVEKECSVRLPLWLLEQLYLFWQNNGEMCFPANQQGASDAEIAAALQEEEDAVSSSTSKKTMTAAQKLQLIALIEEFPMCDSHSVEQVFIDNMCDSNATRTTLYIMLNPETEKIEQNRTPLTTAPSSVASAQQRSWKRRVVANLSLAQQEALHYHKLADEFAEKKFMEVRKSQRYLRLGNIAAADYSRQVAREHGLHERKLRKDANSIIFKAHEDSAVLDLHLLSQRDAIILLKERLSMLDRPDSMRNGRSNRRLRVITGYGKSTGGRSVIKSAVELYLKRKGYFYSFANIGEVVIQCK